MVIYSFFGGLDKLQQIWRFWIHYPTIKNKLQVDIHYNIGDAYLFFVESRRNWYSQLGLPFPSPVGFPSRRKTGWTVADLFSFTASGMAYCLHHDAIWCSKIRFRCLIWFSTIEMAWFQGWNTAWHWEWYEQAPISWFCNFLDLFSFFLNDLDLLLFKAFWNPKRCIVLL